MWAEMIILSFIVFLFYWIIGGAGLAAASFIRNAKIRRARFGCFFTLASYLTALGAMYTTFVLAEQDIYACAERSTDTFRNIASFIACGSLSMIGSLVAWFIILMLVGLIMLYLARTSNQSWMDKQYEDDADLEITFDNL